MTFLKSTQKGLLKNVQDGNFRPLGNWEIHKIKKQFTLYILNWVKKKKETPMPFVICNLPSPLLVISV